MTLRLVQNIASNQDRPECLVAVLRNNVDSLVVFVLLSLFMLVRDNGNRQLQSSTGKFLNSHPRSKNKVAVG